MTDATDSHDEPPRILVDSLQLVPIDDIREHPDNPREGNVAVLTESLDANGMFDAVKVQRSTGYILAGNHTYRAMRARGATEIPVLYIDTDDEAHALRIMLAANRTADLGAYNNPVLLELLQQVQDTTGLLGTGYDEHALNMLAAAMEPQQYDNPTDTSGDKDEPHKTLGDSIQVRVLNPQHTETARVAIAQLLAANVEWQASCV